MASLTVSINASLLRRQIDSLLEAVKHSPQLGRQVADLVAADVSLAKAEPIRDGSADVICLCLSEPFARLLSQYREQLVATSGEVRDAAGR